MNSPNAGSPCQAGSYSASAGASACSQCPLGAKPDPKLADCLCPVGTFSQPIANTTQISCNSCPTGAVCTAPGVTLAGLITAAGWWRAPNTLRFYPCRFPELCLGGLGNVCEFAREGALCSVCVAGYSSNGAGVSCLCVCVYVFVGVGCGLVIWWKGGRGGAHCVADVRQVSLALCVRNRTRLGVRLLALCF